MWGVETTASAESVGFSRAVGSSSSRVVQQYSSRQQQYSDLTTVVVSHRRHLSHLEAAVGREGAVCVPPLQICNVFVIVFVIV